MAWSTRRLADLTGVTVKAIRHYHEIGLLDEPDRASNGYKLYSGVHLIRVLQIKTLTQRGFSLAQVGAMDAQAPQAEAVRELDAQLKAEVERLVAVRAELAQLLEHEAPADLPTGFAPSSGVLTNKQRSLLTVYDEVFSPEGKKEFLRLITDQDGAERETEREFEQLAQDADDEVVDRLARGMVPMILQSRQEHPWAADPLSDSPLGAQQASSMLAHTVVHIYNPAQIRVMRRIDALLREHSAEELDS